MELRRIRHQAVNLGRAIAISSLVLIGSGCAIQPNSSNSEVAPEPSPQTSEFVTTDPDATANAESASAAEDEFSDVRDLYQEALKYGESAISLSQSAFASQDWELVVSRWQKAIALLERVPSSNANYGDAQQKLQEFRTQLSAAQQKVDRPSPSRTVELDADALAAARQAAQQANQTAAAGAGNPAAASSFTELCDSRSSLAEEARRTVQALLELANTEDCAAAATTLSAQTVLDLGGKEIVDLQPLTTLSQMKELRLGSNAIADLTPLASLSNLETLLLNNNQIDDVAPLRSLTRLKTLVLNNNQIADVAPLATLTALEQLELRNNAIEQVAPLASLIKLQQLSLSDNQIESVRALSPLTQLKTLALGGNPLTNKSCPVTDKAVCQF